jgi:uncharacterized protein YfaS (alpha-2-macroglobulin family)
MKRNTLLLTIIGVLSAIIIVGGIYTVTQYKAQKVATSNENKNVNFFVKSFSPEGKVSQRQNFTLTFSQTIAEESLINTELDNPPIKFTPQIRGRFQWVRQDAIRFFPEMPLAPSTEYTAQVLPVTSWLIGGADGMQTVSDRSKGADDATRYVFKGKGEFAFFTARFRVKSAALSFESNKRKRTRLLGTVEFNYSVHPAELTKHLTIAYDGGESIPYQIQTKEPNTIIQLTTEPVTRGLNEQRIQLGINKALKGLNCYLGLERDYTSPIILRGKANLRISSANVDRRNRDIRIRFSAPVDAEAAKPYVTVTPELNFQLVADYRYLNIKGDFKSGTSYTVKIKQGMSGGKSAVLKRNYSKKFTIPDIEPSLRFVGEGFFLPRDGNLNLGLATTNIGHVKLEIERVVADNIVSLLTSRRFKDWMGKSNLIRAELQIESVKNEEVTTALSLAGILSDDDVGIFRITARDANYRWRSADTWLMVTDLGLMAKEMNGEMWVWLNSLNTLKPIGNAEVQLITQTNHTLQSGRTDSNGLVKFQTESVPFLITASKGGDLSFFQLNPSRISTTNFSVAGGRYPGKGYDAYIYTERGVYRPGETANLAVVVRGKHNITPPSFPVLMQVLGPDKRIMRELRGQINAEGATEFNVSFPSYAKTGSYTAKLLVAKQEVGRTHFSVEEFMPDRIKVTLETDRGSYDVGDEATIDVAAVNLFGPPAADRKVVVTCDIEAEDLSPEKWRSFSFHNEAMEFKRQRLALGESKTDPEGKAIYLLEIPENFSPPSSLRGILTATVSEPGGRAVSAYQRVNIHPYSHYVGIRRAGEGHVKIDEEVTLEYIAIDKTGESVAERALELTVYKLDWNTIVRRNRDGRYRYISKQQAIKRQTEMLTSGDAVSSFRYAPTEYGEYRIEVRDVESRASASTSFYATGWGYAPWAMANPDRLEIDLDKAEYQPGDVAKAQIKSPFAGKLLLTIEQDHVLEHRVVTLKENTGVIEIPIKAEYKPNAYVSGTVIRSTKSLEKHAPARAFGVVPLKIAAEEHRLAVELSTPATIRPNREIEIPFRVLGSGKTQVTVAAVDEGILQLTDFRTPNPHTHFFRQRGLGVETYDLYSAILPEITSTTTFRTSSIGGDGVDAGRKKRLSTVSVTRVKPVSLWSGLVETDGAGRGVVRFNVPQFNGRLRVMAVAFTGEQFGATEKFVTVREPIVLTPTFPRFISGGDRFTVPVSVFNGTGSTGDFEIELSSSRFVAIAGDRIRNINIEAGVEKQVFFEVMAHDGLGEVTFNLAAKTVAPSASEEAMIVTKLPLRPAAPPVSKTGSGVVKASAPADFIFPSNYVEGTQGFSLTVSSFPAVKFANGISYLLRYPYG